ncbi:MAG: intracellular septation protein A [Cocleimonas sp.]|jgi:intracellular septation protein A
MSNQKKPSFTNILFEMAFCIFIPSMILKKLSDESSLGTTGALIFALSLPLAWGIFEFIKNKKVAFIPALGFISILLTGSIGLLELDSGYIAIKEAAIPLIIGIATLVSTKTRFPLVKTFLYNDMVIEVDKVSEALEQNQAQSSFEKIMRNATMMLAGSFFLSAVLNYALAKYFITSPSGTAEFNSQLGSMNLWSYPVIVAPSMVVMIFAMFYIFRNITKITGLSLEEILRT